MVAAASDRDDGHNRGSLRDDPADRTARHCQRNPTSGRGGVCRVRSLIRRVFPSKSGFPTTGLHTLGWFAAQIGWPNCTISASKGSRSPALSRKHGLALV